MNEDFDPNNYSIPNGNYFALPHTIEDSALVLLSVPWDVTTSYGGGTSLAPDAIIDASAQVDLYDYHCNDNYAKGIATLPIEENILESSDLLRKDAKKIINMLSEGASIKSDSITKKLAKINKSSAEINEYVYNTSKKWLDKGKLIGLIGGDHSTPLGLYRAISEKYDNLGILHIDAHADLRKEYEGFTYSHASIMYNMLNEAKAISKLVQVGIRDYCQDELKIINNNSKIETFFDMNLSERKFNGENWNSICQEIVEKLPQNVHISFDIDGLSPDHCPSTGTPVPGGLTFNEAIHLINTLSKSGRQIIGFDLTEVTPGETDEWDANVGARILYKLSSFTLNHI